MARRDPRRIRVVVPSVPSAGITRRVAPRFDESQLVSGALGVAKVLPQKRPMAACWSAVSVSAVA